MNKEILAKAIMLQMEEGIKTLMGRLSTAKTLKEIAELYRECADICDKTDVLLDELEVKDECSTSQKNG